MSYECASCHEYVAGVDIGTGRQVCARCVEKRSDAYDRMMDAAAALEDCRLRDDVRGHHCRRDLCAPCAEEGRLKEIFLSAAEDYARLILPDHRLRE